MDGSSLADAIFEASGGESQATDELGLVIWDNVDYLIARTLAIAERDRPDPHSIRQPHVRPDGIWVGYERVTENAEWFYRITEYEGRLPQGRQVLYWKRVRNYLPRLDLNIYQISDNLLWDKKEGKIITKEDLDAQKEDGSDEDI